MRPLASAFATVLVTATAACGPSGAGGVRSEETREGRAPLASSGACDGLSAINAARERSALAPLVCDAALTRMALNHARYLVENGAPEGADGHAEISGLPLYTGRTLRERATVAGVAHEAYWISENVGGDATDAERTVAMHLATVFHRSPLMTPGAVALGYATAFTPAAPATFGPSVPEAEALLVAEALKGEPGEVSRSAVVMTSLALADAPVDFPVGLHPAPDAREVPGAFSPLRERPDPVPDLAAPGYPVSVHFPRRRLPGGREGVLVVRRFQLSRAGVDVPARLLTASSEALLFASDAYLVPLAPLPPGRYDVDVDASYGKSALTRRWQFTVER